jgi:hypothetical protein
MPAAQAARPSASMPSAGSPYQAVKAEEAQDAEVVFADTLMGIAHETDVAGVQVGQAAEGVDDRPVGLGVEGVHREVAAGGVFCYVGGEGDSGVAAIGCDIAAESRHLVRFAICDDSDGAVVDAGGDGFQTCRLRKVDNAVRRGIGCDIDIGDSGMQKRVPDATAHEEGLMPCPGQHGADRVGGGVIQPRDTDLHVCTLSARPRRMRAVAPQM